MSSAGQVPSKTARVFEGSLLVRGQLRPARTPDWADLLASVKKLPFEKRTLDGVLFEPIKTSAGWALSMHKPISRSYKSVVSPEGGEVVDWMADEINGPRFAYSTAVVFLNHGAAFALCKGEHQAPGHPDMEKFLKHFLEPAEPGAHWSVAPVVAPAQTSQFKATSRVRSLDLAMTTRSDLFTHNKRGEGTALDALLSALADEVGADMQVRLQLSIEKPQRSTKSEQRLHDIVSNSMSWIEASGTRAVVETEDRGGVREALNLVIHELAVDIALPPESTERQSFRDIIHGLIDQLDHLNARVAEGRSVD